MRAGRPRAETHRGGFPVFPAGGTSEARERPAAMRANGGLAGWELPGDSELNLIFETAAYARLASLLVWSVAAADEGESGWLSERLADMVGWLDDVPPVLPS